MTKCVIVRPHRVVRITLFELRSLATAAATFHEGFLVDGQTGWLLVPRHLLDRVLPYSDLVVFKCARTSILELL